MQIGTVNDRVGIAKAPAERFVDGNFSDLRAGHAIHHDQAVDVDRLGAPGVADTEVIHRMKGVWSDLDAGADFAEPIGLFEHCDVAALFARPSAAASPPIPPPATITAGLLSTLNLHSGSAALPRSGRLNRSRRDTLVNPELLLCGFLEWTIRRKHDRGRAHALVRHIDSGRAVPFSSSSLAARIRRCAP